MGIIQNPDVVTIGGRFGWALTRTLAMRHPDRLFLFVMRDSEKVEEAAATGQVKAFFHNKIQKATSETTGGPDLKKKIQMPANVSFCTLDDFNLHFRGRVKQLFIPAVPSNRIRQVLTQVLTSGVPKAAFESCEILSVSKGMETASLEFPHEIMDHLLGGNSVVALGGNLAFEFVLGDPMLMELAGYRENTRRIAGLFAGSNLIIYETFNRRKLSLAGPMKNIHSLATGMTSEIFGSSSVSTIATMGLSEFERAAFIIQFRKSLQRLAIHLQKLPFNFRSVPIAGGAMSDYHLFRFTRNFDAGKDFVRETQQGKNAEQAMAVISQHATIESFASALPTREFLRRLGCHSPVIEMMAEILSGNVSPETGIRQIIRQKNIMPT
jgi:glycerol-3-phosphate dehydrogenase